MPFAAGSQQQMLNHYQLSREYQAAIRGTSGLRSWHLTDHYGQNMAYGQPYVMAPQQQHQHPPPPQQQPQPQQAQQSHASQQQQPQQQQAQRGGHPLPSPSPVNAGMVIQVAAHENKAPVAPPSVMVPTAAPFKPRPKKMALLQDPETMEVVDLVKQASGSDATQSSASSTSLRSTPSADSVKAESTAAADAAVPEPAKNLPNVSLLIVTSYPDLILVLISTHTPLLLPWTS